MINKIISKLKNIPSYSAIVPDYKSNNKIKNVNFPDYFIDKLSAINDSNIPYSNINILQNPTIYNVFVRLTTAFNHSNSEQITNQDNKFKETGTILKTIVLLPYIKSLGTDILYLLPITSIGKDGKKGDIGSPYSINHPYLIDENINEPLLNMTAEEQFAALVEAAHKLGMKVVCEFVFRTASKDSAVAIEHPEWFYWIKKDAEADFHSPIFDAKTLNIIKEKIEQDDYNNLPEPPLDYINQFTDTPQKVNLVNDKIIGYLNDEEVVIPGAFADWPPDDIQPPWSDVTYLKIYDNPEYNYISYNTIRMYDNDFAKPIYENASLWRHIENIIPYYISKFDIDGVMIDMGHALPDKLLKRIVAKARRIKKDFIFFEENFVISESSAQKGFDCVLGPLPFDTHIPEKVNHFINNIQNLPIKCFATSETHNTPRTASRKGSDNLSKISYLINKILPIPTFIHSGFELCETLPVNTGLGFENIDTTNLNDDVLPLFSTSQLNWTNDNNIIDFIIDANAKLEPYLTNNYTIKTINTGNKNVVCVELISANNLLCIANYGQLCDVIIDAENRKYKALLSTIIANNIENNKLILTMPEFSYAVFISASSN
ncbi:MAG: alpha-amylase family glycosyl hydrolase [Bacteroidetes bacterium]|nr:alpha-amylase family glycosyl hydrolase [Bacteroidota bacterium]